MKLLVSFSCLPAIMLSAFKRMLYKNFFLIIVWCFLMLFSKVTLAQYEYPTPPAQLQTIKAGSLIIPMDTVYQRVPGTPGYFNLKAYGLVNALLQSEIPVMWSIRAGKTRASAFASRDFIANVTRVFPDTNIAATDTFRNGPFIIDSAWVTKALSIISSYGNNVYLYKLNANTSIDIRYNLTFKPYILLLNDTNHQTTGPPQAFDTITVHVLQEAGFGSNSYYLQIPAGKIFTPAPGYSMISEAHYAGGDTTHVNPVMRYINQYGANLIVKCAAIGTFENIAHIMTNNGIDSMSTISATNYYNPDQAIAQFLGNLYTSYGEYVFWNVKSGSTFNSSIAYQIVRGTGTSPNYIVTGAKLRPNTQKGGNVFYLPGHDFYSYNNGNSNDNNKINGRRIFLNAALIPPNDSAALDFTTDIALSMIAQSGLAVKNESFKIYIIASNIGHWRAKNISVQIPFPAGLIYQSHTLTNGIFNSGTGVWSLDSLIKGRTDTLALTVKINQLGNIVFNGIALNESFETVKPNNSTSITLFGVSRPDANLDTMIFSSPLFQDINTKNNDTDEDGGPFGNLQILNGPYHGTAQVINGDTIRYTLGAGYTGIDSLQYLTCDQYPLCDSTWVLINIQSPLPITLLKFEGKRNNGKVDLHWITLSEKNNDYFSIERGTDASSFEARGVVDGSGNSNIIRDYYFSDIDDDDPVYYYRLRQFDFNGDAHLSPVIALTHKQDKGLYFNLIPNPVGKNQQLLALIKSFQQSTATLNIADITGRIIIKKEINITGGNQIEFLNITDNLETGCYIATLFKQYETTSVRLVIQ